MPHPSPCADDICSAQSNKRRRSQNLQECAYSGSKVLSGQVVPTVLLNYCASEQILKYYYARENDHKYLYASRFHAAEPVKEVHIALMLNNGKQLGS